MNNTVHRSQLFLVQPKPKPVVQPETDEDLLQWMFENPPEILDDSSDEEGAEDA